MLVGRSADEVDGIELEYPPAALDLKYIPRQRDAGALVQWAESYEQRVYAELDSFGGPGSSEIPSHIRLEGVLWLEHVKFSFEGQTVAPKRMLMVDDLHRLRRKQRALLIDELTVIGVHRCVCD